VAAAPPILAAHAQAPAALTGQVSSAAEGPMEGVVVSAKRDGSTLTISVVSDNTGKFSYPASKLEPGRYSLAIRAVGYDLDGPKTADVAAGRTTTADIKLRPTRNLAKQLTNAEWLASFPRTDTHNKALLYLLLAGCHYTTGRGRLGAGVARSPARRPGHPPASRAGVDGGSPP